MKLYDTVKTSGIDGEKNLCPFAHFFLTHQTFIRVSSHLFNKYLSRTYKGPRTVTLH